MMNIELYLHTNYDKSALKILKLLDTKMFIRVSRFFIIYISRLKKHPKIAGTKFDKR